MKNLRKAIALLLAVALLVEPCIAAGSMNEVKAAETATKVYDQMKVIDISLKAADGQDIDALSIEDAGVKLITEVTMDVPEGWAVSEISVDWQSVKSEDYNFEDYITKTYSIESQPENHVYVLEHNLHKYRKEDIYVFSEIDIELVEISNTKNRCWLWGMSTYWNKLATAENPLDIEWELETEEDYFELESTKYYGDLDYTILKTSGKDTSAPLVTALKMKTTGTLNKNIPTEIDVTFTEKGSGIKTVSIIGASDTGEDYLSFKTDEMEKYTGKKTVTLKSDLEELEWRRDGKYGIHYLYIEDYAGNATVYYNWGGHGDTLVAAMYVENEDGTVDETTHEVKSIFYKVCNGHVYKNSVIKATTSANGSVSKKCKYCDALKTGRKTTISKIKTVKLSKASYVYDGKAKKPIVSVYDAKGNKIAATNYTVTYPSGRKNAGEYKVKIVFKNNYKGTVYKIFTIKPKGTSINNVSGSSKMFTVKWKKQETQTTGYQVRYSTSSSFKTYNSKLISNKNTTSTMIKNLKAGKKYYVKVRTYKTVKVNGQNKKIYSSWSGVKTVTTK